LQIDRFSNVTRIVVKPTQPDLSPKTQFFRTKTAPTTLTANAAFLKHCDLPQQGSAKGMARRRQTLRNHSLKFLF
jgi:hypothetical protein